MAQFSLENDINNVLRSTMEAPLTKVPLSRWQRRALNDSSAQGPTSSSSSFVCNSSVNNSLNQSNNNNLSILKTPKATGSSDTSLVGTSKTPKKTPGKSKSPGRSKTPKTPVGGDRFIPNRSTTQFGLAHFKVNNEATDEDQTNFYKNQQMKVLSNTLHGQDISTARIISYATKAPAAPEGFQTGVQVLYSNNGKTPASVKKSRFIPQAADKILDAPQILDDYYLNVISWGCNNVLAVGLAGLVYLWNASTGEIDLLLDVDSNNEYISSLSWVEEGNMLAVGISSGQIQLWDCEAKKKLRTMNGHTTRVPSLSWNEYILSSGSRTGFIMHSDVRRSDHEVAMIAAHTQEVCGLRWATDGQYLASGGNDNLVQIWSVRQLERYSESTPLYSFNGHQAAVKALAWCPWQPSILASGGGTADRSIRLWNCNNGICLNSTDAKSQVCSILWSTEYKELISGHGFANNHLSIWKYPTMKKVADLTGHSSRVLNMAMSPDGTTVASAGADETLRLWNCFQVDPVKVMNEKGSKKTSSCNIMRHHIR